MMTLTRFAFVFGSLIAVGLTGCGDDDGGNTVDCGMGTEQQGNTCVSTVDAGNECGEGTMEVDGVCLPIAPATVDYDSDEGGEVRVEYVRFPGGNAGTRTTAFFYKNSGTTKYFPYLDLNGCTDFTARDKWPEAVNPIAERDYYDVGPNVTILGGTEPYVVPKRTTAGRDPFFRDHPGDENNPWYFEPVTGMDTDGGILTPETFYDVVLPGSAEFPGTIFDDGIYMPADFDLVSPLNPGPYVFERDEDQTFTWEVNDTPPPAGVEILSLLAFTNAGSGMGGPIVVCVEPNDGSITVPAAMMNVALDLYPGAANQGTVARQTLTHQVRTLPDPAGGPPKRVDLLGVWCYGGTPFSEAP